MGDRHSDSALDYRQNGLEVEDEEKDAREPRGDLLGRLEHFTWANYCLSMSTGGISLLISEGTQPNTFYGQQTIGKVMYIFDLFLFTLITAALITRFIKYKGTFLASLAHPTEGLFCESDLSRMDPPTSSTSTNFKSSTAACFFLSLASIIGSIARYGIPNCGYWLVVVYRVVFWVYFAATMIYAVGMYMILFTSPKLKIDDMTPAWDLPIFPFMLSGTIATIGAGSSGGQPAYQAMPMIVAGLTAQGLGMLVSIMMYACYIRRMVQFGLPSPHSRPAMFIAVGPPGFTALALIGLAKAWPTHYNYFGDDEVTSQILRVVATMTAVFIWSSAFWFFCLAVASCLICWREIPFSMSWYAFIFPNVGFTIATINIGQAFESTAVEWVGTAMTLMLIAMYLFVFVCQMRALIRRDVVAEGKDEDVYINELRHKYGKVKWTENDAEKQA